MSPWVCSNRMPLPDGTCECGHGPHVRVGDKITCDECNANRYRRPTMHYRNGREAKNGDRIIKLDWNGKPEGGAILFDAVAGNDYCNGSSATVQTGSGVCLVDALHVDDVAAILAEKGLDKRPAAEDVRVSIDTPVIEDELDAGALPPGVPLSPVAPDAGPTPAAATTPSQSKTSSLRRKDGNE